MATSFVARAPEELLQFLWAQLPVPSRYGQVTYYAEHAFRFTAADTRAEPLLGVLPDSLGRIQLRAVASCGRSLGIQLSGRTRVLNASHNRQPVHDAGESDLKTVKV